jgi:hypothetical protein
MVTRDDVVRAIDALRVPGSSKGVSRAALRAYLCTTTRAELNRVLKLGVESGRFIKIGDSFKTAK